MKLRLAYQDGDQYQSFDIIGTQRSKNQSYKVTPLYDADRLAQRELIGYMVTVVVRVLDLPADFEDTTEWVFAMINPDYVTPYDYEGIKLGSHGYSLNNDKLIMRHTIEFHTISINFRIAIADYDTYTDVVEWNLPTPP